MKLGRRTLGRPLTHALLAMGRGGCGLEHHIYCPAGQASKRVILYAAGNDVTDTAKIRALSLSAWARTMQADVACFNYRGVIRSAGDPSTLQDLADDVETMIDELVQKGYALENIVVVGHSLGGAAGTLAVAKQYRKNPHCGIKLWNLSSFSRTHLGAMHRTLPRISHPMLEPTLAIYFTLAGWNQDMTAAWHTIPDHAKGLLATESDNIIKHPASLHRSLTRRPHHQASLQLIGEILAIPLSLLLIIATYGVATVQAVRQQNYKQLAIMPLAGVATLVEWALCITWRLISWPYRALADVLNWNRSKSDQSSWRECLALPLGAAITTAALIYPAHRLLSLLPTLGSPSLIWALTALGIFSLVALALLQRNQQPRVKLHNAKDPSNPHICQFDVTAGNVHDSSVTALKLLQRHAEAPRCQDDKKTPLVDFITEHTQTMFTTKLETTRSTP